MDIDIDKYPQQLIYPHIHSEHLIYDILLPMDAEQLGILVGDLGIRITAPAALRRHIVHPDSYGSHEYAINNNDWNIMM